MLDWRRAEGARAGVEARRTLRGYLPPLVAVPLLALRAEGVDAAGRAGRVRAGDAKRGRTPRGVPYLLVKERGGGAITGVRCRGWDSCTELDCAGREKPVTVPSFSFFAEGECPVVAQRARGICAGRDWRGLPGPAGSGGWGPPFVRPVVLDVRQGWNARANFGKW